MNPRPPLNQSPPRRTATAKLDADLIDRAHREAGRRMAAGDRAACASSVLTEWAERGEAVHLDAKRSPEQSPKRKGTTR